MKRDRVSEIEKTIGAVQTATLVRSIPNPQAFTFELKWDGYRIVAIKAGDVVRLVSRKAQDYSAEFPSVVKEVAALAIDECAIDGEICALDERGVPSFQLLQNRGRKRAPIAFFVFDLLWVDGEDLRDLPIEKRRARLAKVIPKKAKTLVVSTAT